MRLNALAFQQQRGPDQHERQQDGRIHNALIEKVGLEKKVQRPNRQPHPRNQGGERHTQHAPVVEPVGEPQKQQRRQKRNQSVLSPKHVVLVLRVAFQR